MIAAVYELRIFGIFTACVCLCALSGGHRALEMLGFSSNSRPSSKSGPRYAKLEAHSYTGNNKASTRTGELGLPAHLGPRQDDLEQGRFSDGRTILMPIPNPHDWTVRTRGTGTLRGARS